jgi:predicted 2-oxoglutarate/Fe(II)-dependent dioxygenase YbiX
MNNLFDYVYVENILSKQFCERSIELLDNLRWEPHTWYGSENGSERKLLDRKDFSVTYDLMLQIEIKDRLFDALENYFKKHPESYCRDCSVLRFNKYSVGEKIDPHVDHISGIFNDKKGIPILSVVGLLNDNFDGGEFMLCNQKVDLKAGDVLIFPSIFLYPHEVKPVTKGTRYSWVLWGF